MAFMRAITEAVRKTDLDDIFAYTTPRLVRIRDRRLGLTYLAAQIGIAVYVIVYQIVLNQAYLVKHNIVGSARLQLRQPAIEYRWQDAAAPYCMSGNASGHADYAFPTAGMYRYLDPSGGVLVTAPQGDCKYLDARYAVPNALEANAIFLPTRTTIIQQQVTPMPECATLNHTYCAWATTGTSLFYTVDAEMFTLWIDHNLFTNNGETRGQAAMQGVLLGQGGRVMDVCAAYTPRFAAGCPRSVVSVGAGAAQRDIVAMRTLLNAAGVDSLDEAAGVVTSLRNETKRYSGIVMFLSIDYSNFYGAASCSGRGTGSFNTDNVQYVMRAFVVPETDFKNEDVQSLGEFPAQRRVVYNRHGVRVLVQQGGCVGVFDFQALLINLTVSLGLLSAAIAITNFLAFSVCPLRYVYQRYAIRHTIDFSDLRDATNMEALHRFRDDRFSLQPVPVVFQSMFEEQRIRQEERRRVLEGVRGKAVDVDADKRVSVESASSGSEKGRAQASVAPAEGTEPVAP